MTQPTNDSAEIDEQQLRDIFNANGLNYSQILGDELTTVSMELQDFNYSLKQIQTLIDKRVNEARIEETNDFSNAMEAELGEDDSMIVIRSYRNYRLATLQSNTSKGDE